MWLEAFCLMRLHLFFFSFGTLIIIHLVLTSWNWNERVLTGKKTHWKCPFMVLVHRIGHNYFKYLWIQVCVGVIAAHMCFILSVWNALISPCLLCFFSSPVFVCAIPGGSLISHWSQLLAELLPELCPHSPISCTSDGTKADVQKETAFKCFALEKTLLYESDHSWSTRSWKLTLHALFHVHPHKYILSFYYAALLGSDSLQIWPN